MFNRTTSVISLDPIDRNKQKGLLFRFFITRFFYPKYKAKKSTPFGHYLFCGAQGTGKTASALWYTQYLTKKYTRNKKHPINVHIYSNIGIGTPIDRNDLFTTIDSFTTDTTDIRIVIIDEIQTYFPTGTLDKTTRQTIADLTAIFSQLRKRRTFILSTAQIYGRLDKALREQCLYMVNCKISRFGTLTNDFIAQENILCDDLGRWSGQPSVIYKHGLSSIKYDTTRIIRVI